jgi:hypothetical protein
VDYSGLRESLQPPASLVLGHQGPVGRLFIGDRIEHPDLVARHRQPEGQVGILGDVVRVPGTTHGDGVPRTIGEFPPAVRGGDSFERHAAEVIAGAPERGDKPQPGHADEHPAEVGHVLGPVKGTDPAPARVPEHELGLQAADALVRRAGPETRYRLEQLVWFGAILGIVDGHDLAGGVTVPVVTCLRLGARPRVGGGEDLEVTRQVHRGRGDLGFLVVFFQQEQDLQFPGRVTQAGKRLHQGVQDVGFPVQRHQDRVPGQIGVVFGRENVLRLLRFRRGAPDDDLEDDEDDVERDDQGDGHLEQDDRPERRCDRDSRHKRGGREYHLAGAQQPRCGFRLVLSVHRILTSRAGRPGSHGRRSCTRACSC